MASETITMNGNVPLEVTVAREIEHKLKEEEEVEKRKQRRRNKDPLLLCKLIVDYPKIAFAITLAGHLILSGTNGILALTGYDIIPVEFERFPVTLRETDVLRREWAWRSRNRGNHVRRLTINDTVNINPVRGGIGDTLQIIYESKSGNIFNQEALRTIKQIEDSLFKMKKYQSIYCQWDINNNCTAPESIIRYFDGTFRHINPIFYDPEFENITEVLYEAENNPHTNADFQYFLSSNAVITKSRVISHVTRTTFLIGWPLPGSEPSEDKRYGIGLYLADEVGPEIEKLKTNLPNDIKVYYFSFRMFLVSAPRRAFLDMGLAFGSVLFIFAFIWFQTKSFWITSWSVFSLVSCFFVTNLFYRTVLGYKYFGYFHIIVIFIILGIGADDIFVFFNTWKSTGGEEYPSLAHRLSDCYRRAAATMLVTSLTTMAAFLVSGLSPLLPINSFGIFSGLLVAVNYISVIVFFPAIVVMYHNYFESYQYPCCKGNRCDTSTSSKPLMVKFFSGPFYRFITHKIIRWILIIFFLSITAFFGWAVSKLKADAEQVQIYRRGTNLGDAWFMIYGTTFRPMDSEYVPVWITWGVGKQDLSSCAFSDSRCRGRPTFDHGFDMNFPNVQLAVKNFCHKLRHGLTEQQLGQLMIRRDPFTKQLQVECFIEKLENHMMKEAQYLNSTQGLNLDLSLPFTEKNMKPFMEAYDPLLYNTTLLSKSFYRYFEIAVGHWLTNGYSMLSTPDYYRYFNFIGEITDPPHTKMVNFVPSKFPLRRVGFEYGTRLRYAAVMVNLSISYLGLGYTDGIPVYHAWEEFTQKQLMQMPYQLRRGYQTNSAIWHWLFVQQSLVDNAIQGIVIGILIAWPVLILATGNLIIGTFATLVICIITVCVIGVIPLAGWNLGVLTSMNLCLVVGLSVDYVVHLAEGYHMSEHKDRLGRVHDMLSHVGISVVSGAITTLGAAFFMFFGQIQFFLQFGAFMFSCIGSSMLFSLGFFSTVLALCGPQNDTGSIYPFFSWICFRFIGRSKEDKICVECDGKGFLTNKNITSKVVSTTDKQIIQEKGVTNSAFIEQTTDL